ncbi:transketolase [Aureococcus anophagefferens]|nr:transketolase [Aureococcus anophagefferens]
MKFAVAALAGSAAAFMGPAQKVSMAPLKAATLEVAPATSEALQTAANEARGLAMDSIAAAESGHLGLPLGAAEMGAVLYGQSMNYNPDEPKWINRDRFVLSAGHGSMFLYSWLHLAGFDLSKDEVANFRQHHSMTPGHPEFPNSEHVTPGIEATTGPRRWRVQLRWPRGASKMSAAIFNTDDHTIFDNHIFCILDNLIVLYDANDVTLDKMAEFTQSEDVGARYEAYGWDVITLLDGHDLKALYEATEEAKSNNNGKPTLIICKTEIGRGIDEKWFVSDDTYKFFADRKATLKAGYEAWEATYDAWKGANPDLAKTLQGGIDGATPELHQGRRRLGADFGKSYSGRNVYYGIREHAMGCILNGFAYYGLFRPSGATFLVFADYMRATVRIAALAELPVSYIWTHDSIGVGEDGPTHQPVETVTGLRAFPNLDVIRPADYEETAGAYVASIDKKDGPTALILSRQNLQEIVEVPASVRREGTLKGAYTLVEEKGDLECIIIATGSEVQHAYNAAKELGDGVRVVSMPCMERFDRQDAAYKESVLPAACRSAAMEAGVTTMWYKYVGLDGKVIGVDRFGFSAPGDIVMEELGMTAKNCAAEVKAYMG